MDYFRQKKWKDAQIAPQDRLSLFDACEKLKEDLSFASDVCKAETSVENNSFIKATANVELSGAKYELKLTVAELEDISRDLIAKAIAEIKDFKSYKMPKLDDLVLE